LSYRVLNVCMCNSLPIFFCLLHPLSPSCCLSLSSSLSVITFAVHFDDPSNFLQNLYWSATIWFQSSSNPHSSTPYIILGSHNISYVFPSILHFILGALDKPLYK
jgi:hypothetical protein